MAIPRSKPQETRQHIAKLVKAAGFSVLDRPFLVAIRGYYPSMGKPGVNDINIYDDALFLISPDTFESYNFNTDPSRAKQGLAMLVPQTIRYMKGIHNRSKAKNRQYEALIPFPDGIRLACTRDGVKSTCANTNIHYAGRNGTGSAGCMTMPKDQWDEFKPLVYNQMSAYWPTNRAGRHQVIDCILVDNQTYKRTVVLKRSVNFDDVIDIDVPSSDDISAPVEEAQTSNGLPNSVNIPTNPATTGDSPESVSDAVIQYIPKVTQGRRWLGGLSLSGSLATIAAAFNDLPPWALFAIGFITAIAVVGLTIVIIRSYGYVVSLTQSAMINNADPATRDIILTSDKPIDMQPVRHFYDDTHR